MVGVSGYSGDLTERYFTLKTMRPAVNLNLKYNAFNNLIVFRAGVGYGQVSAHDKDNKGSDYIDRNLNFKSNIIEGSFCVEVNIFSPDRYDGYPYAFAGAGIFHFDPYTFDKANKKTYLQPLSTEGQGLSQYPDRKPYSLTQFCIPFGIGWKMKLNQKFDIIYELGSRLLFTDYLDDVSTSYVDPDILLTERGATAVELAYKRISPSPIVEGLKRGNPKVKDQYYFSGIKILYHFGGRLTKVY